MDALSAAQLIRSSADPADQPLVIDVRRSPAFLASDTVIAGALRRDPAEVSQWCASLPAQRPVVVYCVHGHEVSQGVAQALQAQGIQASYLQGGLEGWRAAGGKLAPKPPTGATAWVTRARPKIDRIACPWLVARFIDTAASFLYVSVDQVMDTAAAQRAVPFDVQGVELGHHGERCSFDAFVDAFRLGHPALSRLADIVRAADTGRPSAQPEAAGLLALSQGLSINYADDHAMLAHGMVMYDALYSACGGRVTWPA